MFNARKKILSSFSQEKIENTFLSIGKVNKKRGKEKKEKQWKTSALVNITFYKIKVMCLIFTYIFLPNEFFLNSPFFFSNT